MVKKQGKGFILMNNKFWLLLMVSSLLLSNCKEDNLNTNNDFFTPVQVYLNINLSLPNYTILTNTQGFVYEPGGNKGIIIYHTVFNEFVAFDRTCPHNPGDNCSMVSVDSSSTFFRCGQYSPAWVPCCNSKFDPATGSPLEGPAKRALKQYFVKQDGNNLIVTNTPQ
jgi:Rieske Fe-S protein